MKGSLQNIAQAQDDLPQVPHLTSNIDCFKARMAIYDSLDSTPQVFDFSGRNCEEFINILITKTYQFSQERGGIIPFSVIKEVVENLVHASFNEVIITIIDGGNTIRIADQGPGIQDKDKVFGYGFSTANSSAKQIIKGVGSGLPIALEIMSSYNGKVLIEDNIMRGAVVTLTIPVEKVEEIAEQSAQEESDSAFAHDINLTDRQKRTLFIVTELGEVGPSKIAAELDVSLSTAYRDLTCLEQLHLIQSDEKGRRSLTTDGVERLDSTLHS